MRATVKSGLIALAVSVLLVGCASTTPTAVVPATQPPAAVAQAADAPCIVIAGGTRVLPAEPDDDAAWGDANLRFADALGESLHRQGLVMRRHVASAAERRAKPGVLAAVLESNCVVVLQVSDASGVDADGAWFGFDIALLHLTSPESSTQTLVLKQVKDFEKKWRSPRALQAKPDFDAQALARSVTDELVASGALVRAGMVALPPAATP